MCSFCVYETFPFAEFMSACAAFVAASPPPPLHARAHSMTATKIIARQKGRRLRSEGDLLWGGGGVLAQHTPGALLLY